jgi:RNA polymerase sigma factor (sigma-70 family)
VTMHIRFPAARPETDHMHMRPSRAGGSRIATDPAALDAFYRQHIEAVTRFLARRTTDPFAVADMTAEVFVAAIRSAADFEPGLGSERAWLYGIARNVVASERRRAARERDAVSRFAGRRLLDDDDIGRMEARIDAEAEAREARATLAGLADDERALLELVAIDGLAVKDAAVVLGIKPGTARVRLHRARRAASSALGQQWPQQAGVEQMTMTTVRGQQ